MSLRTAVIPEVDDTDEGAVERNPTDGDSRRRIGVFGVVQGVGFRPFVYGLAHSIGLAGHVGNDAGGVFVEIEGPAHELDEFTHRLTEEHPPLARIDRIEWVEVEPLGESGFGIVESTGTDGPRTLVPPDVATCDDCLAELADPADRRHRSRVQ